MIREVPEEELLKRYDRNDLVKADCGGCRGCHLCCTGMGNSVTLDPYDADRMAKGLSKAFSEIPEIEWHITEEVLLPNLKMTGQEEACAFLDQEGRCSIHELRPGLCRLFPLGRVYEEEGFRYFLQLGECPKAGRIKVKVRKWIGEPDMVQYEDFVNRWHEVLVMLRLRLGNCQEEDLKKQVMSFMAKLFYLEPYGEAFYPEFYGRCEKAEKLLSTIRW